MFLVQTGRAKRTRKYSILMIVVLAMIVSILAIFTMHWDVLPKTSATPRDVE
jgi:hypothetical protein